ncbi:MAG: PH domain-containing protein [Anaerolineales bacterium]|nr:PH domain-containing protein [Anaerolineales bacterium]
MLVQTYFSQLERSDLVCTTDLQSVFTKQSLAVRGKVPPTFGRWCQAELGGTGKVPPTSGRLGAKQSLAVRGKYRRPGYVKKDQPVRKGNCDKIHSVEEKYAFEPPRRQGLLFQAALAIVFGITSLLSFFQMLRTPIGWEFVFYFIAGIFAAGFVPWAVYRWFALRSAVYWIERNGLRIRWGLRWEELPMSSVRWVRSEVDVRRQLGRRLPLPWGALPGAILGTRQLADGTLLEYFASDFSTMVLVATDERVFILSPAKLEEFLYLMQRLLEFGAISPWQRRSQDPTYILGEVWRNPIARSLLVLGLLGSLTLMVWVSLLIPNLDEIYLSLAAEEPTPSTYLLLLPLTNGFFYGVNALVGIYFYRRGLSLQPTTEEQQLSPLSAASKIYAYLLWGFSILTTVLFYFAISFLTYVE